MRATMRTGGNGGNGGPPGAATFQITDKVQPLGNANLRMGPGQVIHNAVPDHVYQLYNRPVWARKGFNNRVPPGGAMAIPYYTKSLFFRIKGGFIIIRKYADEVFEILIIIKNEIRREIIDFKNRTLADKASLIAGIIIWFHLIFSIGVSNQNQNLSKKELL